MTNGPQRPELLPQRPASLPAEAWFHPGTQNWTTGSKLENGEQDGDIRVWTREGVLYSTTAYRKGKADGRAEVYWPDGSLRWQVHYVDGKRNGIGRHWRRNGALRRQAVFRDDQYDGRLEDFDELGRVTRATRFTAGCPRESVTQGSSEILQPARESQTPATLDPMALRAIEVLNLSEHHLVELPDWFFALPKLRWLDLSQNPWRDPEALLRRLATLPSLERLKFRAAGLTRLDLGAGEFLKLRSLDLRDNPILDIALNLAHRGLDRLSLDENTLRVPRRGMAIVEHLQGTTALAPAERELHFALFLGDNAAVAAHASRADLVPALNSDDALVRIHALIVLRSLRENPLLNKTPLRLKAMGTRRRLTDAMLHAFAARRGHRLVTDESYDAVVLGENPGVLKKGAMLILESEIFEAETAPPHPGGLANLVAEAWLHTGGSEEEDEPSEIDQDDAADPAAFQAWKSRRQLAATAPDPLWAAILGLGLERRPRLWSLPSCDLVATTLAKTGAFDRAIFDDILMEDSSFAMSLACRAGGDRATRVLQSLHTDFRLDLEHQGLEALPREINRLPLAKNLDLSHNHFRTLPSETFDLWTLDRIDLSSNRIASLPSDMARAGMLRALYLNDNKLASVPPVIWDLSDLELLNLGNNRLSQLPESIGKLAHLEDLSLYGNPLTALPESFANLQNLSFLHLGNTAFERFPNALFDLARLETLWISGKLRVLPMGLARMKSLRALMLWGNALAEFPADLFEMTWLRELRIKDAVDPMTLKRLEDALPECKII